MTVQLETRLARHSGNGISTVFPYQFVIPEAKNLQVYTRLKATGQVTLLQPSQYSATGFGSKTGGTVTYKPNDVPMNSDWEILIFRVVSYIQQTNFLNSGGFYPEAVEAQLDYIVYEIQQLATGVSQSYKAPLGSTAGIINIGAPGQGVQFDSDGNLIPYDITPPQAGGVIDPMITPLLFGAVGDGVHNDSPAFNAMCDSATVAVYLGDKRFTWNLVDPVEVHNPRTRWVNNGSVLKYNGPIVRNMVRVRNTAKNSYFGHVIFDHNAINKQQAYLTSEYELVMQDAVIGAADDCTWDNCEFLNAFGNGLGLNNPTWSGTGTEDDMYVAISASFSPLRNKCQGCYSYQCGLGSHIAQPWWPNFGTYVNGWGGSGINFLNASRSSMNGCVSDRCNTGFIIDYGSGATGNALTNCIATNSIDDPTKAHRNGWGFWIGGPQTTITNCVALGCRADGFVISHYANSTTLSGCIALINFQRGFVFAADRVSVVGCQSLNNSVEDLNLNTGLFYPGFEVRPHANALKMTFSGCLAEGLFINYGLMVNGAFLATVTWAFGQLSGTVAPYIIGSHPVLIIEHKNGTRNMGINTTEPEMPLHVAGRTTNTLLNGLGDFTNNGHMMVADRDDPTKRMAFGYDVDRNRGVIQAVQQGIRPWPLELNSRSDSNVSFSQIGLGRAAIDNTTSGVVAAGDISLDGSGLLLNCVFIAPNFVRLTVGPASVIRMKADGTLEKGTAVSGAAGTVAAMTFSDI